jgi:WD40 repeat protein
VSLAISQTNACVIAGLEDARVLIWDLVTGKDDGFLFYLVHFSQNKNSTFSGNCRCILTGHNAPVTLLKLDPTGKVLLSADKEGRDKSIRLWELETGKSLAVYTPNEKISACEILKGGLYIALALENRKHIVTLTLKNCAAAGTPAEIVGYGNPEHDGKVFNLAE